MSAGEAPQIGWNAAFFRNHVFLLLGSLLGAAFWLLHAVYDYSAAELGSFWDCLAATDPDILAMRLAALGIAVAAGAAAQYLAARLLQRQDLRVLFDKANDGLVLLEVETCKIVDCNEKACKLLGYPRNELLRLDLATMHPHDHELATAFITGVLQDGAGITDRVSCRTKSGELLPAELSASTIVLGRRVHVLVSIRDISERVAAEEASQRAFEERRQAEDQLRQAQKMEAVGQLTGGVAHDFNNLLAIIHGNAELIHDSDGFRDPKLDAIVRAAERGAELTQRLLAFSRRQRLEPQAVDLGQLIGESHDLLARTLGETIVVEVTSPPGLWNALVDPGQVENALLNLAINARDAMPKGGALTIACDNADLDEAYVARNPDAVAGEHVVLAVSDTGTGIPAEIRPHVFEPFFTTKDVGQGSGLGLSMVYGFAKQSGGHVTLDSADGQGTTVKLYLPRAEAVAQNEAAAQKRTAPRGQGETVLVIEDDPDVRALEVRILEELGYQAIDVADAAGAHEVLADRRPVDLVLSDVVLPGGTSGPEFAAQAQEIYTDFKTIFVSGYPVEAANCGPFPSPDQVLLNKPFKRQQLAEALREALD